MRSVWGLTSRFVPTCPPQPTIPFEARLTRFAILLTGFATVSFLGEMLGATTAAFADRAIRLGIEGLVFTLIAAFVIYGNLIYEFMRLGYLIRLERHKQADADELLPLFTRATPSLTFLIPSYKEEGRIIRQALLSAAFQEYPNKRVVLLIDDPVTSSDPVEQEGLRIARHLPQEIDSLLSGPRKKYAAALSEFLERQKRNDLDWTEECIRLSDSYKEIASWFEELARQYGLHDHTDVWFVRQILTARVLRHREHAEDLRRLATLTESAGERSPARLPFEYRRLAALFSVELSSFERKRYRNLSHEPNKAMNLNSYLGLMGKHLKEVRRRDGLSLEEGPAREASISIPDTAYVATLDADSLLLPDYALRLIHLMETPGNEKIAVVQTPYSAVPHPASELERIAGATTDIQYCLHQGSTQYDGTFWVGANALLRKAALDDLEILEHRNGSVIRRYIKDWTVIEDTESTLDLVEKGWRLLNYPERLSYSATPADFGSLLIQRGRWANGGLLILPKLLTYLAARPRSFAKVAEGLYRFHYLTSLAGLTFGLLILFSYPFHVQLSAWWLPLAALPCYGLYARDLRFAGYRAGDLLRVYALNLLLVPVHLGGVLRSLRQAWTGQKIPFRRTPKVTGRTRAPAHSIVLEYALLAFLLVSGGLDFSAHHWVAGTVAFINGGCLLYAIGRFIGFRESLEDLLAEVPCISRPRLCRLLDGVASWSQQLVDEVRSRSLLLAKNRTVLVAVFTVLLSGQAHGGVEPPDPKAPLEPMAVAITVDDLPAHGETLPGITRLDIISRVIEALTASRVGEVYGFTNGGSLDGRTDDAAVLRAWLKAGYPLGNHTATHMDLTASSAQAFIADIERADRLVASLAPISPTVKDRRLFRYPYLREGETEQKRNAVRDYLLNHGYRIAPVTIDYSDWAWTNAYTRCHANADGQAIAWLNQHVVEAARRSLRHARQLARRVVGRDIKHILLIHAGLFTGLTLPDVLNAMKADGVAVIDLERALADPVYQINPKVATQQGMTFLEQLARMKGISDPGADDAYTPEKLERVCNPRAEKTVG